MNETVRKQAAFIFLLGLAAVALYLCYLISKPFLGPFLIAVMLAIVFITYTRGYSSSFTAPVRLPLFRQPWYCSS